MKKLFSLVLALAMCVSLAACGGGEGDVSSTSDGSDVSSAAGGPTDAQIKTLTEAYNEVAVLYNDVATKAQENGWTADEETNTTLQTISATLDPVGTALTGDMSMLDGADFDELPKALLEWKPQLEELAAKVAEPYDGDGAGVVTDEALKPLANAYNEVANLYNEVYPTAEANGWLNDEQTSAELDAVYGIVTYVGSGLSDDPSKLEDADLDGLTEQLQQFGPALEEIGQRVSVPYEG